MTEDTAAIEIGPVVGRGVIEISQSLGDRRRNAMAVYYTPEAARDHAERILDAVETLEANAETATP